MDSLSDPFVPALVDQLHSSILFLSVTNGIARIVRAGLLDRTLDLIVTNDPMDDVDGIVRHPILTEGYILVVPRTGAKLPLTDLNALARKLPMIRWNPQSRTGQDIERRLRRMGADIERRFEFDSPSAILSMVSSGLGWAIMNPLTVFEMQPLLEARSRCAVSRAVPAAHQPVRARRRDRRHGGADRCDGAENPAHPLFAGAAQDGLLAQGSDHRQG